MLGRRKYLQLIPVPVRLKSFVWKCKKNKLPGDHQIRAEVIQVEGGKLCCKILRLVNLIWNMEEMPDQSPIHEKGSKTGDSNYRGISLVNPYKSLTAVLTRLTVFIVKVTGNHYRVLRHSLSTAGL
jgi:hypothetical protein